MATLTARRGGSFLGLLVRDANALTARARASASPLARHGMTFAAIGCGVGAAWSHSLFTGLIATGAGLVLLDHKVQEG